VARPRDVVLVRHAVLRAVPSRSNTVSKGWQLLCDGVATKMWNIADRWAWIERKIE